MTNTTPRFTQPIAFVPIIMSLVALALVLGRIAIVGVTRSPDEGAIAHTWQLLIMAQAPIIAFFAIKYLPQRCRQTATILAVQVCAVLVACAPVYFLHL